MPAMRTKVQKQGPKKRKVVESGRMQIRKALLGLAETKVYRAANSRDLISGLQYWLNPLYWITNGTGDTQRIGDEIFITDIKLNLGIYGSNATSGSVLYPDCDRTYSVMLVKATEEYHQGTIGDSGLDTLGLPDIRYGAIGNPGNPIVDNRVFSVVWRKQGVLPQKNYASTGTFRNTATSHTIKINQKFQFRSQTNGYGKTTNFYIYFAWDNIPTTSYAGFVVTDLAVNFKDM